LLRLVEGGNEVTIIPMTCMKPIYASWQRQQLKQLISWPHSGTTAMDVDWYRRHWRGLELANSRSPVSGRPWSGLREERDARKPTEFEWTALAKYTALHCARRDVDHRTAFQQAYGVTPAQEPMI
jgi:hypothetical protein